MSVPSRKMFDFSGLLLLSWDVLPMHGVRRDSFRLKTAPQTLTSSHSLDLLSDAVKPFVGCIIRTPFVVTPSSSPFSFFHLVAFSFL
jgi:hypothetical protein